MNTLYALYTCYAAEVAVLAEQVFEHDADEVEAWIGPLTISVTRLRDALAERASADDALYVAEVDLLLAQLATIRTFIADEEFYDEDYEEGEDEDEDEDDDDDEDYEDEDEDEDDDDDDEDYEDEEDDDDEDEDEEDDDEEDEDDEGVDG